MKCLPLLLICSIVLPADAQGPTQSNVIQFKTEVNEAAADDLEYRLSQTVNYESVTIIIDSPGGSVISMYRIIKAIQNHPKPVICIVDGMAASAAAVILQACDIRKMTPLSLIMYHGAASSISGKEREIEADLLIVRAINENIAWFVSKRIGMDYKHFKFLIETDYWLGPESALKMNFVDSIL